MFHATWARNRFGGGVLVKPNGSVVWVHAASLGELTSVRPFLQFVRNTCPRHQILVTTNNPAALDVAANWEGLDLILQAAPLDLPFVIKRFLRKWQPAAFVNVEAEIWPNRFAAIAAADIPAVMLNARVSERSAGRLQKVGAKALGLLGFAHVFTQNAESAKSFEALGIAADRISVTPNFKSLVQLPLPDPALAARFDRASTLLAASTHEGEDEAVVQGFSQVLQTQPDARLILAPRHPRRSKEVLKIVETAGLSGAMFSEHRDDVAVQVVDTLGLLQSLYGLAAVTFVGGSVVDGIGGHTPYEPIAASSAIVVGPFVSNFTAEYQALKIAKACVEVQANGMGKGISLAMAECRDLTGHAAGVFADAADVEPIFQAVADALELSQ